MPCLELSVPRLDHKTKTELAAELTKAFCSSTGHPADIFGIRFFEYDLENAALGGSLCSSGTIDRADWMPTIHICEHPYDNVIVAGKLLSDAYDECAKRSFYYELPKD